jgi:hypothetical protein
MSYASYIFLFAMEETIFCGAKRITTFTYITRKLAEILQVKINRYIIGDN